MSDEAQARLLHELAKRNFQGVTPAIRAEILDFFSVPNAPYSIKKDAGKWQQAQDELSQLRQFQVPPKNPPKAALVPAEHERSVSLR
jgi:hypothetical protein